MNEQLVLPLQIEALRDDLTYIENTLKKFESDLRASRQVNLLGRVRTRLDYLLATDRTALTDIETRMAEGRLEPNEAWGELRKIRQQSKKSFQACLAIIEGALVRYHGFDEGLCKITDALLDEISLVTDASWRRFSILADRESFANIDEVIRIRFPSPNIWDLPFAAHEFGHFVSESLLEPGTGRRPFAELSEEYAENAESAFLPEYFSDMFAAYTVGPSYACACIVLRFDYGAANSPIGEHPSADKRVYALLRTLTKMDEFEGSSFPQYSFICNELGELWRKGLIAAFQRENLDEDAIEDLDKIVDAIYALLANDLPPRVRYERWLRAQELSNVLRSRDQLQSKLEELRNDDTITDVINAAWLSRVLKNGQTRAREFSADALAFCNEILKRKADHSSAAHGPFLG